MTEGKLLLWLCMAFTFLQLAGWIITNNILFVICWFVFFGGFLGGYYSRVGEEELNKTNRRLPR